MFYFSVLYCFLICRHLKSKCKIPWCGVGTKQKVRRLIDFHRKIWAVYGNKHNEGILKVPIGHLSDQLLGQIAEKFKVENDSPNIQI